MIINKIIKIINRQAQKVFAVAYMRSNCGKFWCFGLAVVYGLWSLVRGVAMDEVRLYLICSLH